jgi:hypothetical protein
MRNRYSSCFSIVNIYAFVCVQNTHFTFLVSVSPNIQFDRIKFRTMLCFSVHELLLSSTSQTSYPLHYLFNKLICYMGVRTV